MANEEREMMWLYTQRSITLVELAEASGLPEATLRELVEYGALAPSDPQALEWSFSAECVTRVRKAARLREDLELETPALAVALSFLERIARLEDEVRRLQAQLARPRG
jgi:chaperone modulatory protein CbpM